MPAVPAPAPAVARPDYCGTCTAIALALLYLFRLAWLIWGTVLLVKTDCGGPLVNLGRVYMVVEWSLIGAVVLLACSFCWFFVCCAALLAGG